LPDEGVDQIPQELAGDHAGRLGFQSDESELGRAVENS
jgi:hypothetical protein